MFSNRRQAHKEVLDRTRFLPFCSSNPSEPCTSSSHTSSFPQAPPSLDITWPLQAKMKVVLATIFFFHVICDSGAWDLRSDRSQVWSRPYLLEQNSLLSQLTAMRYLSAMTLPRSSTFGSQDPLTTSGRPSHGDY